MCFNKVSPNITKKALWSWRWVLKRGQNFKKQTWLSKVIHLMPLQ